MDIKKIAEKIKNAQLARLLTLALCGKLASNPNTTFTARGLDKGQHGSSILRFLKKPDSPYPAKNDTSRNEKIIYILKTLVEGGVDLEKELQLIDTQAASNSNLDEKDDLATGEHPTIEAVARQEPAPPQNIMTTSQPEFEQLREKNIGLERQVTLLLGQNQNLERTVVTLQSKYQTYLDNLTNRLEALEKMDQEKRTPPPTITTNTQDTQNTQVAPALNFVATADDNLAKILRAHQELIQQLDRNKLMFANEVIALKERHQKELETLRERLTPKESQPIFICGLRVGITNAKYSRPYVAYAPHNKKIYLGTNFDLQLFEDKIRKYLLVNGIPLNNQDVPNYNVSAESIQTPENVALSPSPLIPVPNNETGTLNQTTPPSIDPSNQPTNNQDQ